MKANDVDTFNSSATPAVLKDILRGEVGDLEVYEKVEDAQFLPQGNLEIFIDAEFQNSKKNFGSFPEAGAAGKCADVDRSRPSPLFDSVARLSRAWSFT